MWRLYAIATSHSRFPAGFQELHDQFVNRFGPADGVEDGLTEEMVAAFSPLASRPEPALIHRYETRLHNVYQRALFNCLLLRTSAVPEEPNGALPSLRDSDREGTCAREFSCRFGILAPVRDESAPALQHLRRTAINQKI